MLLSEGGNKNKSKQYIISYDSLNKTRKAVSTSLTASVRPQFSWLFFPSPVFFLGSVQFSSATQSCPTLCDPMNCSTPGLPVHHQLPEFTQTHVHPVSDAIQPSHPLSSPSPPAPNPSQHQSLSNESTL